MKYGRYGWPYFWLRAGLGLAFLYFGLDLFIHPNLWEQYLKAKPLFNFDQSTYFKLTSSLGLVVGSMLLAKITAKLAGGIAVIFLLVVLINNGFSYTLPGTIGLLSTALAITVWPSGYHRKKHWWNRKTKAKVVEEE